VVTGEIFPLKIRAKGISLSAASNWLWNWAIAYSSEYLALLRCVFGPILIYFAAPYLVDSGAGNLNLGTKVFYIWGSTCFCCIIFAYFCIPETKGLSLEQIDVLYQNVAPINSVSYRKRLLAEGTELSASKGVVPTTERIDELQSDEKV
jgi:hypothetical protein